MSAVFKNHIIICNWNRRGKTIVTALRALSDKPILIICVNVNETIKEIGDLENVFVLAGDPTTEMSLRAADVGSALSVLILASESLGASADAESVKIALLVEQIEVTVYTVVELLDIRNKSHFAWTKVDDLVADQDLTIRLVAQGIRHLAVDITDDSETVNAVLLMDIYEQLVNPFHNDSQLFQVSVPFNKVSNLSFQEILIAGMSVNLLPCALVGYVKHTLVEQNGRDTWESWKTDVQANPAADVALSSIWPEWPGEDYELGIVLFAQSYKDATVLIGLL